MKRGEGASAGYLVWRLSNKWRAGVDRALAHLGLTHAQYSLLASLYGMSRSGARPSQRELADVTGLDPIYVSKLARALERAGLVERAEHSTDSRAVQLALTARGMEVVVPAVAVVMKLVDDQTRALGGVHGERTRELVEMLQVLLDSTGDEP